jgi:hypothetical protein
MWRKGWNVVREWLPNYRETLVLSLPGADVMARLRAAVSFSTPRDPLEEPFWGWITEDRFRISLKIARPNAYLPVIKGVLEPTRNGSILFLQFQLLPTTRLFLVFWTLFIVLATVVVTFQYQNAWYLAGGLLLAAAVHAIVWGNFHLQRKISRARLLSILNPVEV